MEAHKVEFFKLVLREKIPQARKMLKELDGELLTNLILSLEDGIELIEDEQTRRALNGEL